MGRRVALARHGRGRRSALAGLLEQQPIVHIGFDAVAAVFDAVGRAQIFDVVVAVVEDHRAVFARDVAIPDREVGLLASSTDDELVFIDRIAVVVKDQRERRATTRGKPLPATEATLRLLWLLWGSLLPSARVRESSLWRAPV